MAELLCILYKLQYRFYSNYFLIDFSVFCTSSNFQFNEWQMAGKVWQNEEMFVAVTGKVAVDFAAHLVPVWFGNVSVSFRCALHQAPQEQKQTGRQRYEEILVLNEAYFSTRGLFLFLRSSIVQFWNSIFFTSFTDRLTFWKEKKCNLGFQKNFLQGSYFWLSHPLSL